MKHFIASAFILLTFLTIQSDAYAVSSLECFQNVSFDPSGVVVGGSLDTSSYPACTSIDTSVGFQIPTLSDLLTFGIRILFAIAGVIALFQMLLGALGWIVSGGEKDKVTAARDRIQAAIVGMILMVSVLSLIWTLEQVVFKRRICLGLTCPLVLPGLIETSTQTLVGPDGRAIMQTQDAQCCVCPDTEGNGRDVINTNLLRCNPDGTGSAF